MGTSSPFFIPPNLLPSIGLNTQDKVCKSSQSRPPASSQPLRHQICDDWSWHDDCNSEYCPKLHICIVCKCPDHQSQSLPPSIILIQHPPSPPGYFLKAQLTTFAAPGFHHSSSQRSAYLPLLLPASRPAFTDPSLYHSRLTLSAPPSNTHLHCSPYANAFLLHLPVPSCLNIPGWR